MTFFKNDPNRRNYEVCGSRNEIWIFFAHILPVYTAFPLNKTGSQTSLKTNKRVMKTPHTTLWTFVFLTPRFALMRPRLS